MFAQTIDKREFVSLVKALKRARSILLCREGPTDAVLVHRRFQGGEHTTDAHQCWCNPVFIGQKDYRASADFANEVLYPVIH